MQEVDEGGINLIQKSRLERVVTGEGPRLGLSFLPQHPAMPVSRDVLPGEAPQARGDQVAIVGVEEHEVDQRRHDVPPAAGEQSLDRRATPGVVGCDGVLGEAQQRRIISARGAGDGEQSKSSGEGSTEHAAVWAGALTAPRGVPRLPRFPRSLFRIQ